MINRNISLRFNFDYSILITMNYNRFYCIGFCSWMTLLSNDWLKLSKSRENSKYCNNNNNNLLALILCSYIKYSYNKKSNIIWGKSLIGVKFEYW